MSILSKHTLWNRSVKSYAIDNTHPIPLSVRRSKPIQLKLHRPILNLHFSGRQSHWFARNADQNTVQFRPVLCPLVLGSIVTGFYGAPYDALIRYSKAPSPTTHDSDASVCASAPSHAARSASNKRPLRVAIELGRIGIATISD